MIDIKGNFKLRLKAYRVEHPTSALRSTVNQTGPLSTEHPETTKTGEEDRTMDLGLPNNDEAAPEVGVDSVLRELEEDIDLGHAREDESRQQSSQPHSASSACESNTVATTPEAHDNNDLSDGEPMEGIIGSQAQSHATETPSDEASREIPIESMPSDSRWAENMEDFDLSEQNDPEVIYQGEFPLSVHNAPALQPNGGGGVHHNERAGSHVKDAAIVPGAPGSKLNQLFQSSRYHLDIAKWTPPNPGRLPASDNEYLHAIDIVERELANTAVARDGQQYPKYLNKFLPDGVYRLKDFESIALSVVQQAYRLCTHGAASLFYLTPENHPVGMDVNLDFGDRIEGIKIIVRDFKSAANSVMCDGNTEKLLMTPNASYLALENSLKEWEREQEQQQRKIAPKEPNSAIEDHARFGYSKRLAAAHAQNSHQLTSEFGIVHGQKVSPKKPQLTGYMGARSATTAIPSRPRTIQDLFDAPAMSLTRAEWDQIYIPITQGLHPVTRLKLAPQTINNMRRYQEQFTTNPHSAGHLMGQGPVPQRLPPTQFLGPASNMATSQGQYQREPPQALPVSRRPGVHAEIARPTSHQMMGLPRLPQLQPQASQQPRSRVNPPAFHPQSYVPPHGQIPTHNTGMTQNSNLPAGQPTNSHALPTTTTTTLHDLSFKGYGLDALNQALARPVPNQVMGPPSLPQQFPPPQVQQPQPLSRFQQYPQPPQPVTRPANRDPSPHPDANQERPADFLEQLMLINQRHQRAPPPLPPATSHAAVPQTQQLRAPTRPQEHLQPAQAARPAQHALPEAPPANHQTSRQAEEIPEIPAHTMEDLRQLNQLYQYTPSPSPPPATSHAAVPQVPPRIDFFSLPRATSRAAVPQEQQQAADPQQPPAEQIANSQEEQPPSRRQLNVLKRKGKQRAKSEVADLAKIVGEDDVNNASSDGEVKESERCESRSGM